MTCEICEAEKAEARAEIRRLSAEGVADDVLAPAALRALTIPDHDTAHHPVEGLVPAAPSGSGFYDWAERGWL